MCKFFAVGGPSLLLSRDVMLLLISREAAGDPGPATPLLHTTCSFVAFLRRPCPIPFTPPFTSWDAFQIPHGPSYQARSLQPDWFSHDTEAPPCHQGDAAVTCHFREAHRLVVAQNRLWESFRCKAGESGAESAAE